MDISDLDGSSPNDCFVNIKRIGESLTSLMESGTSKIARSLSTNESREYIGDLFSGCEDLLSSIKYIGAIKKIATISDLLFLNKFEKYCRGLLDIPIEKRQRYAKKVGKERLNRDSVFILNVPNRIEELSKLDKLLKLFEAKIDERIDDQMYRRLMLMVDRTMLSDLEYMEKDISCRNNGCFSICNDMEQGLLSSGWLSYEGQTIGDLNADVQSQHIYRYSRAASVYYEIMRD